MRDDKNRDTERERERAKYEAGNRERSYEKACVLSWPLLNENLTARVWNRNSSTSHCGSKRSTVFRLQNCFYAKSWQRAGPIPIIINHIIGKNQKYISALETDIQIRKRRTNTPAIALFANLIHERDCIVLIFVLNLDALL